MFHITNIKLFDKEAREKLVVVLAAELSHRLSQSATEMVGNLVIDNDGFLVFDSQGKPVASDVLKCLTACAWGFKSAYIFMKERESNVPSIPANDLPVQGHSV